MIFLNKLITSVNNDSSLQAWNEEYIKWNSLNCMPALSEIHLIARLQFFRDFRETTSSLARLTKQLPFSRNN